jgi:hypothetical protein
MPVSEVLAEAKKSAMRQGFSEGDRVLSSASWDTPAELIDGLVSVLAAGASLVQVVNPDPTRYDRRAESERVTVRR